MRAARLDGEPPSASAAPGRVGPRRRRRGRQARGARGDGELVIGGIGLARYLDPEKDAEKYAPCRPWAGSAYRSGDLVRYDEEGLVFGGRADDQVKVGGRRIELGEIDSALLSLSGVTGAAAAVRSTGSGNTVLVGYLALEEGFDLDASLEMLRARLPTPLCHGLPGREFSDAHVGEDRP